MTDIQLRPYQVECKKAIKTSYDKGVKEQLIVMATGTGKRLASVELMRHFNRSLFIAHREELIGQAYDEISKFWPMQVGIIKGPTFELDKKIVVASVQTLQNRLDRIPTDIFDYIVIDECHNYLSPSYLKTIRHFQPKLRTAWTATPKRLDGLSLTNIAQEVVFQYRIEDGIKDGWLAGVEAYQIRTNTNIADVRRVAGDFNQGQLSERVDSRSRNAMIATKYLHYARGRQAIAYCVDVKHSYNLRDILREHGVNAETIVGDPQLCPNRRELINRFKNGEIDVLTNCEVLCLDLETEILTNNGWKSHDTIYYSDKVANYDMLNGKIYFKEPEDIVLRPLYKQERMASINSKGSNIRVTNTHRMLYKFNRTDPQWKKTAAENLVNKTWIYPVSGYAEPLKIIVEQEQIKDKDRAISANAYNLRKYNGYSYFDSISEAERRFNQRSSMQFKNPNELTVDECRLIGFWIGDGSVNYLKRGGVEYTLSQSKSYPSIVKWIDSLLNMNDIHYIKIDKKTHYVWSINRGTSSIDSRKGLYHLEPYLKKDANELLWGLDNIQWRAFIEGFWYADGLHGKADNIPESKRIYSVNNDLLSLIQAISICRGLNATISLGNNHKKNPKFLPLWIINIEERTYRSIASNKQINRLQLEDNSTENVWCVKTETKNIITRRNGQVCIMGNTEGFDYSDIGCILMGRPTQSERLYIQAIGRGTRLKSQAYIDKFGSSTCIVLDFVDNCGRLSLVNSYELERDKPIEDRMFLPKEHKDKLLALKAERERKIAIQVGKDKKINLLKLPEFKVWESDKMLEPATEKQIKWIKEMGVWQEDVEYTKSMASELISAQPAKEWQMRWLAEQKYDVSNGCTLGQYQRVKYSFDLKNKFAMDEKEKNKILNKLKDE